MKRGILISVVIILILFSCRQKKDYTRLVNVFIGTDFHGHTFPGATMPHGMIQLSPDTRTTTWDGCSGYHYSDKSILGFSHTHFSGTGAGGGGDIMLIPGVGKTQIIPGEENDPTTGYRASFLHKQESGSPGYYRVNLEGGVTAELTASDRVGFHRYTFNDNEEGHVFFDLSHGINDQVDSLYLQIVSDSKIAGFRHAHRGLEGDKKTYFSAEFSRPFSSFEIYSNDTLNTGIKKVSGRNLKACFRFKTEKDKSVLIKVALSRVDPQGAENNLKEIPGWDFESVRKKANESWNRELGKIEVEGGTEAQRRTFYTALYHSHIHPNIWMDTDRRYMGTDRKIRRAEDFDNYTTFSLWDTFRALHPLFTLIDQKRTNQYIRSFIERYQHFGYLPIMEFGGNEGFAMIGYHSLPVIADAWVKGIRDYDVTLAYKGMKKLSEGPRGGKKYYREIGFIPYDNESQSVSKTLEYCYDDWCVSQMAKVFSEDDYHFYAQKSQFYRNVYSQEAGFMRPRKMDYKWLEPFDPMMISGNYTEGNGWQYSTFVPHDINSLIGLMGGEQQFENWLDTCFSKEMDQAKTRLNDVTGLIGQYAHGNEPSHNMAYLYNYVGKPWKTQKLARQIMETLYSDQPDGLCGNEDAGQMSAWYILSSMGLYPVTPGLDYYVIGSPLFSKATLHLENGKKFVIEALNSGTGNPFIQSAELNGTPYTRSVIRHSQLMNGGKLVFKMGGEANQNWGKLPADCPATTGYLAAPVPEIITTERTFLQSAEVSMRCTDANAIIRYMTDGSDPDKTSPVYSGPFQLMESGVVKARSFVEGLRPGYVVSAGFEKLTLQPALQTGKLQPGVNYEYIEGYCMSIAEMNGFPVLQKGVMPVFNIDAVKDDRAFGYRFSGYIYAPADGIYTFWLASNDGSSLIIDGRLLIDNDGGHGKEEKTNRRALEKGYHSFELNYFQMGLGKALEVSWQKPDGKKEAIPANLLFH